MKRFAALLALTFFFVSPAFAKGIQLTANLSDSRTPSVIGKTNLPDGTKIAVELACPMMYCQHYWSADATAIVHTGSFSTPPFSNDKAPLDIGRYVITVVILDAQDPKVSLKLFDIGWDRAQTFAYHFTADVQ